MTELRAFLVPFFFIRIPTLKHVICGRITPISMWTSHVAVGDFYVTKRLTCGPDFTFT
jgi:hypothetical protein